jgi:dihydrofolate reductase
LDGVSAVLSTHSISLDGFIARPDGKPGRLHDWMSPSSGGTLVRSAERVGAIVVGRKTYDDANGFADHQLIDVPNFVVTHRPPDNTAELPFVFVTEGLERAIELAREAAGGRDVTIMGGDLTRQALSAGLLDELHLDLVPVMFGEGVRFLDDLEDGPVRLERIRLVEAPAVAHVSFRVLRN